MGTLLTLSVLLSSNDTGRTTQSRLAIDTRVSHELRDPTVLAASFPGAGGAKRFEQKPHAAPSRVCASRKLRADRHGSNVPSAVQAFELGGRKSREVLSSLAEAKRSGRQRQFSASLALAAVQFKCVSCFAVMRACISATGSAQDGRPAPRDGQHLLLAAALWRHDYRTPQGRPAFLGQVMTDTTSAWL
ncbi:hypothetical protein EXIGLDRAFT_152168 [Exidia glandulosa HHB12029]|uniref:Uncharacterized protein n=1 Tax=Exidia glandulosa HHB12029 TaxID=1314781 RepID=A0A165QEN4_EXIGL|nr:hypothetical protein EXIGLDRAFT_152168 [Exidia glandulosa HHB12029]